MKAHSGLVESVLVLLLLQYSAFAQHVPLSSRTEWSALYELRSSLGLRSRDWPKKADPCSDWVGIECRGGRVVGIKVSGLRRTRKGRMRARFAVDSLANLTLLVSFNSSGFALPGSIPEWFGQRLNALQVLDLRSSSVFGPVPSSLGQLSKLNSLYLSDNSLTGAIPPTLGQLFSLTVLDLGGNLLTGSIPSAFSSLRNLNHLDLSSNYLSGPIPPGLGSLGMLQFLYLSNNSFTNSIPKQLGNLSGLIELDLGTNFLSGALPLELRGLRILRRMLTGNNLLEGSLPSNLFLKLTQLRFVVLSGNEFDGALPNALWTMPELRFFDASRNNLTGILPNLSSNVKAIGAVFNLSGNMFYGDLISSIGKFNSIDLSGNYFQGKVPNDTRKNVTVTENCLRDVPNQRSLADCRLFYSQRDLKFDDFGLPDGAQPMPEPTPRSNKRWVFVIAGIFGGFGFIVLLVFVLVLLVRRRHRGITDQRETANMESGPEGGNKSSPEVPINVLGVGESFTYEQMLLSTGYFSEENIIKHGHSGDLFRGILEGGIPVVIKRVDLCSLDKESYTLELNLFSKVSHPRLIPLLGHCLERESEKLLVYKYMPNGDLSSSLYRSTSLEDDGLQSLDWITRLKIATEAAEGLSYLHNECSPPLVHGDVQASSILLDDKFEVRLGSLGKVRVLEGDSNQNAITRMFRMPQTSEQVPSESSSATCSYDVYCFGKVLLELVTGKLGISKSDNAETKEWLDHTLPYISRYDKELLYKIVDPSLIVDEDLLEEVWAMAVVASSCVNARPSKRPPMRYVLRALENPLKVVREENSRSARLRTTSSRKSWSSSFFGSLKHSSSEGASVPVQAYREGAGAMKLPVRIGSQSSGANEISSYNKRLSNEIFPEPIDPDMEKQDDH